VPSFHTRAYYTFSKISVPRENILVFQIPSARQENTVVDNAPLLVQSEKVTQKPFRIYCDTIPYRYILLDRQDDEHDDMAVSERLYLLTEVVPNWEDWPNVLDYWKQCKRRLLLASHPDKNFQCDEFTYVHEFIRFIEKRMERFGSTDLIYFLRHLVDPKPYDWSGRLSQYVRTTPLYREQLHL